MTDTQSAAQLSAIMSDTPAPIYLRVKQAIISQIRSGKWSAHQRIPSENALVTELGVSRMTINRALRELTAEGYLLRMQGVGTFVAEVKPQTEMLEVRNIAEEIAARGHRHSSRLITLQGRQASRDEAIALGIQPGAQLFHSLIVHYENQIAVQLEDRCVNPLAAPDYLQQDFAALTPYSYLMKVAPLTAGEHRVEAINAGAQQRELLQLAEGEPCLQIHRRTWSGRTVVTSAQLLYPGSRYQLFGSFIV